MRTVFIPGDADLLEGYLCASSEDAQRIAQQWAQDLADDKQETVGCYYEIVILNKDVNSLEELDEDTDYYDLEDHFSIVANPVEPPCGEHGGQHNWINDDNIVVHGEDEEASFSQTCSLCGCQKHFDPWHNDGYGDFVRWISYTPADGGGVQPGQLPRLDNDITLSVDVNTSREIN